MASLESILGRVKKLLALATSSNVHEAAAAAATAQALINRHRLSSLLAGISDDPDDPIGDGRDAPLEVARRFRRWKLFLATGLAIENGGLAWSEDVDGETRLCFCGYSADRAAVQAVWSSLVLRIEWLSATHGPGRTRQWHEAFRIGAAEVIVERMAAGEILIDADEQRDRSTNDVDDVPLTALMLSQARPLRAARVAAVEAFAASRLPKGRRSLLVDLRAVERGRQAALAIIADTR